MFFPLCVGSSSFCFLCLGFSGCKKQNVLDWVALHGR